MPSPNRCSRRASRAERALERGVGVAELGPAGADPHRGQVGRGRVGQREQAGAEPVGASSGGWMPENVPAAAVAPSSLSDAIVAM